MSDEGQSNLRKSAEDRKRQSGQLVLEYILLMILAVGISSIVRNLLVGGNPDNPAEAGLLTQYVYKITVPIAEDLPGE